MTTVTQTDIDNLLQQLKFLLEQITTLRDKIPVLEKEMAQAQQAYDEKLGPLNTEAERLEGLKASLKGRLAQLDQPEEIVVDEDLDQPIEPEPVAPPVVIEPTPDDEMPPPPVEDPRSVRKRALADHVYYFLDSNQNDVMEVVNAVLSDEQKDVGDMLEILAWGDIWTARAEAWESLANQYNRLLEWKMALEQRLAYWQSRVQSVETNTLWAKRKQHDQVEWQAFLDDLYQQQSRENERLAHEVTVLAQEWQRRQREKESLDG